MGQRPQLRFRQQSRAVVSCLGKDLLSYRTSRQARQSARGGALEHTDYTPHQKTWAIKATPQCATHLIDHCCDSAWGLEMMPWKSGLRTGMSDVQTHTRSQGQEDVVSMLGMADCL